MTASQRISLAVKPGDSPVAGRYFEDTGSFVLHGAAPGARTVTVWSAHAGGWVTAATPTVDSSGHWVANKPVTDAGVWHFIATLGGGRPDASSTIKSAEVTVTVREAMVKLRPPNSTVDALKNPTVSGGVYPAVAGVVVTFQVRENDRSWVNQARAKTNAAGKFSFKFTSGNSLIRHYHVRARRWDERGEKWITSAAKPIDRVKVLDPVVTQTTAADVADTYHSGCPVGPSGLRTIHLDYYGMDQKMHRGVIIVATGRVDSVVGAFRIGLNNGFRIRQMTNPNHWGGSDVKQMEDDNSSGFNCRKVTGNPYAQSPHSYGIAIDVNTRENPYHAADGKWYPKSGSSFIKRSPHRTGMLSKSSWLTVAFRHRGYFWGGFWSPGTDYQHFEYDN